MDFMNMMKNLKNIAPRIKELQVKIERELVEVEMGEGEKKVKVVLNGKGEILQINIAPALLTDKDLLEETLARAITEGNEKVKQHVKRELKEIFGGISIPGLEKML